MGKQETASPPMSGPIHKAIPLSAGRAPPQGLGDKEKLKVLAWAGELKGVGQRSLGSLLSVPLGGAVLGLTRTLGAAGPNRATEAQRRTGEAPPRRFVLGWWDQCPANPCPRPSRGMGMGQEQPQRGPWCPACDSN